MHHDITYELIVLRIIWKGNTMKMAGGWHTSTTNENTFCDLLLPILSLSKVKPSKIESLLVCWTKKIYRNIYCCIFWPEFWCCTLQLLEEICQLCSLLYILTSVWVQHTPNAGQNIFLLNFSSIFYLWIWKVRIILRIK